MTETLTGEQIADMLREMAERVQRNLDDSGKIRDRLRSLASKLEEEHDAGD